uniref:Vps16 C-terminal domain-containing protein n=1 Tax=Plectus sambesii TaxID=2011161 RepID=A0A914WCI3_9BILA
MNAQSFVDMCRVLRVLNAIRERHFGISLTYEQLSKLTVAVLVDRLIARAQWPLVIAVCQHLRLPPEDGVNRVLGHWACQKIEELKQNRAAGRATTDSAKLADVICRKFREFPGVSYADVAQKAAECELNELATLLLENEPQIDRQVRMLLKLDQRQKALSRATESGDALLENEPQIDRQVRMLLKLDQRQKALSRATESGDPDLIYLVILKLKQAMDKAELNLMLRKFPDAFILYTQLLREEAPNHLLALYRQEDDFCNQALYHLDSAKAAGTFDVREKQNCLAEAEKSMSAVKEECYSQVLNDSIKLLKHQAQFEEQFGQPFTELSLRSTIVWLIEHGENGPAENLRKEFRVGDKQFWWWKIEALGKGGRWQELEAFAKAKKSPIGYLPFVEICVKYKQMSEWKKYLQKMSSHEHQVMANIKTGDLTNAANIAFQNNDDHLLNRVMSHCGPQNRGLSEQILTMKQELAKKSGK